MELTLRLRLEPRLTPVGVARLTRELRRPGRLVALAGVEGQFCEGLDPTAGPVDLEPFAALLKALDHTARPVVALVDGPALGGGCALAATADLVLATPRATFGLPEVLWGLIPAVALPVVARRVGVARARLLALGLPALTADEAMRWGLVDAVVPELEPALERYARQLGRGDPDAQAAVKELAARLGPDDAYADDARSRFEDLVQSPPTRARLARVDAGELPWTTEP